MKEIDVATKDAIARINALDA